MYYFFWKLQFECDPTSVMDAIIQVDEPQSCQYVITVLTSKICAIPHLRPPPVHKPVKIECRPLLTSTEYEKYQNYLKVWIIQLKTFEKSREHSHWRQMFLWYFWSTYLPTLISKVFQLLYCISPFSKIRFCLTYLSKNLTSYVNVPISILVTLFRIFFFWQTLAHIDSSLTTILG